MKHASVELLEAMGGTGPCLTNPVGSASACGAPSAAQAAVRANDSNENRVRYARALAENDKLAAQFPFVAAGAGDVEA